jgi:hypothetical protein
LEDEEGGISTTKTVVYWASMATSTEWRIRRPERAPMLGLLLVPEKERETNDILRTIGWQSTHAGPVLDRRKSQI